MTVERQERIARFAKAYYYLILRAIINDVEMFSPIMRPIIAILMRPDQVEIFAMPEYR